MFKITKSPSLVKIALVGVGATVAAVSLGNALIAALTPRLGPRLNGYFGRYPARFGDLAYIVAGTGSPVVLLHGLDTGRSMAEWRAIFDELAQKHTVYAFDWQGFGMSDANLNGYTADDFAEQLRGFLRDLVEENATVIAAGQSAAFALLAAQDNPQIEKLVLVCPRSPAPDAPSKHGRAEAMALSEAQKRLLWSPVAGAAWINWLRRKSALRRFAHEFGLWNKEKVASEAHLWHISAHQNGAERAQRAFWQGDFACDWRVAWRENQTPTLLIWSRHAEGFDSASEWLALRPDAQLEVMENALLFPHLDEPARFCQTLENWLDENPKRP